MTIGQKIAQQIIDCFKRGNKLIVCGNGGHATQSQHFVAELVGKFEKYRQALPAMALTTDASIMTGIGNDWSFDYVFARQIEALGKKGDILITLSTSGRSPNLMLAQYTAKEMGLDVIEFPRKGKTTAKIQEWQLKMIHDVCRIVEKAF